MDYIHNSSDDRVASTSVLHAVRRQIHRAKGKIRVLLASSHVPAPRPAVKEWIGAVRGVVLLQQQSPAAQGWPARRCCWHGCLRIIRALEA